MEAISCTLTVLLSVLACTVKSQDPKITKEILPDIQRLGETGQLNCTVTRQQSYKVYWSHPGNGEIGSGMVITSDDKINIDEDLNEIVNGLHKYGVRKTQEGDRITYTLIIRRLIPADAGFYTCKIVVKGSGTQNPSKQGRMVVLYPPSMLQGRTSHTMTVSEGTNVTLKCEASGYPVPNVTWVRANGRSLPSPINQVIYRGKDLAMTDINQEHRGVYRCIADNNVRPPARQDVTLYVDFRPIAHAVQSSYGQAQNRMFDVTIECRIAGHPEPDLQWYKLGKDGHRTAINEDDKHKVHILLSHGHTLSISEFWFQLVIINVQANDYGDYICAGRNKLGEGVGTVNLFETSECQGANCPAPQTIGSSCQATASLVTIISALLAVLHHVWHRR